MDKMVMILDLLKSQFEAKLLLKAYSKNNTGLCGCAVLQGCKIIQGLYTR